MFADPAVFSGPHCEALRGDIEASGSGGYLNPLDHMRSVVQHSIQAALGGELCHGPKLAQALKVSVVCAVVVLTLSFAMTFLLLLKSGLSLCVCDDVFQVKSSW